MTPAIAVLKRTGVSYQLHEYAHTPGSEGYGLEAAHKLGLPEEQVFKTLLVSLNGDPKKLAVAVLPVNTRLDIKAAARAFAAKKVAMADPKQAERITGYVVGGISPLGQKRLLPSAIDASAQQLACMYVSGGKRGLDIGLAPHDLKQVLQATFAPLARA